jgi:MFS family permease
LGRVGIPDNGEGFDLGWFMGKAAPSDESPFRWYLVGAGSWFVAFGIQAVMFAYLVTTVLHAPAVQIGIAQASLTIVSTVLLLVGGAVADHVDTRRLLIFGHVAAAVPAAALAPIVAFGYLRFEWLIVYGLFMGLVTAFIMPAREAMMGDVIGPKGGPAIQRAVTTTVGTTMVAQIVGMLIARLAAFAGAAPIILLQVVAQLFGAFASSRLAPSTRHADHANTDSHITRIVGGLREVRKSHALLPITILTLAIGVLFIGAFLVILPVILHREFGGDVQQFSSTQVAFWGGSIVSSLTISRLGTVVNRGRLVVIAMTLGITVLTALSVPSSLPVLYTLVFLWGIGAGVTISMSRTIVQEHAPPAHRARVLSVYQLGFTGGMSIGALLIGVIVEAWGPRQAALVPAGIMALVLLTLVTTTKLWRIRAIGHEASAAA